VPIQEGDFVLVNYVIRVVEGGKELVHDTNVEDGG